MALTKAQEYQLSQEEWRVFTGDSVTQQALSEYLANKGDGGNSSSFIFYQGKEIPVFDVDFQTVLFLLKNKHRVPYSFTAYHRTSKVYPWRMWKEGKKNPANVLKEAFNKKGEEICPKKELQKNTKKFHMKVSALMAKR